MAALRASAFIQGGFPPAGRPASRRRSGARIRVLRIWYELRAIVATASPIAVIGVMNMMLALTDVVMIGRLDPDGLVAIVVVSDLYSILLNFTAGFSAIAAPTVAAALGAGIAWQICTIVQSVHLLVCLVAAAGASALWAAPAIVTAAGVDLEHPDTTVAYARYMAAAFLLMVLFALARHILGALRRSRVPMVAITLALPANAVLNQVCMQGAFGMTGLGPSGAGLASLVVAIGMGGSATAYLFLSRSFDGYRAPPDTERVLDPVELLRLGRAAGLMGTGAVAETGVFLGSTLLVGAVAAPMLVAHTLAFRAMGACYLLLAAFGQATTIRTAYLSSRRSSRQGYSRAAVASCGLALMILLAALFIPGAQEVARLTAATVGSADARLVTTTAGLLPLAGGALALAAPAHLVCALMRARGRPLAALTVMAAGHWGIGLPAMLVLSSMGFGVHGTWAGLLLGALSASLVAACCLHQDLPADGRSLRLARAPRHAQAGGRP